MPNDKWERRKPASRLVDDDKPKRCLDRAHDPPTHIVIPPGKKLVHTCPSCGKTVTIRSNHCTY